MNRRLLIKLIWLFVLTVLFFIIKPYAEAYWASFRDFTNPRYYEEKLKAWSNKSTDFLIGKLGHPAPSWDGVAGNILANRKDLSRKDKLARIIESDLSIRKRESALSILFCWDEKKSIDLSMKILKSGRRHPLFETALLHLAKRKYNPAFPYVIELAKAPDRYNNCSASYLGDFGKIEALPILEDMLKHVEHKDTVIAGLYRDTIQDAIQSIKQQNKLPE